MLKKDLMKFLRGIPNNMPILINTEDEGELPICAGESHYLTDEEGNMVALVLEPCYHSLEEEIEEAMQTDPIQEAIYLTEQPELN